MLKERNKWLIGSGCSNHMTTDKSKFLKLDKYDGDSVRLEDGQTTQIVGIGSISFDGNHITYNVYYMNGLHHNILSVGKMYKNGYNVVFQDDGCEIWKGSKIVIAVEKRIGRNMYLLEGATKHYLLSWINDSWLWHRRICHNNFDNLVKISSSSAMRYLPRLTKLNNNICRECQFGKHKRGTYIGKEHSSIGLFDLVHTDLCGPTKTRSIQGEKYFMLLIGDYSQM